MIVDVHSHCVPRGFRAFLERRGSDIGAEIVDNDAGRCVRFADRVQTGPQFGRDDLTDTKRRLAEMDRMGIDVQVLSGWVDLTGYELGSKAAAEYATAHNEALAEEAQRAPARFRALATAPLQAPDLAAKTLSDAMDGLGMRGAQIATTVDGTYLDQIEGLDTFWAAAEQLGAFILLHPLRPLAGVDIGRYFLDNSIGRPAETSLALAGLVMSGVFERFPDLKMCAVHGGGFVPFQAGRLDQAFHKAPHLTAEMIKRPPSHYVRNLFVDTIIHDPETLAYLITRLGADHILLGTDYPFPMGDQDPVGLIQATPGITREQVAAMVGGNAVRLLSETGEHPLPAGASQ